MRHGTLAEETKIVLKKTNTISENKKTVIKFKKKKTPDL